MPATPRRQPSNSCGGKWALSRSDRQAVFGREFREDLRFWVAQDRKLALRLLTIIEDTVRNPFEGLGKPEPLKFALSGAWSRRLTGEHRLVYKVYADRVEFLTARFHYGE
jgi:toxin YoeB